MVLGKGFCHTTTAENVGTAQKSSEQRMISEGGEEVSRAAVEYRGEGFVCLLGQTQPVELRLSVLR